MTFRAVAPVSDVDNAVAIGDSITGGTATDILYIAAGPVLAQATGMTFSAGAIATIGVAQGTITTDTPVALFTSTWNNAAVATGFKIAITDTTSDAGSLPFSVYGGAAGTTALFGVDKTTTGVVHIGAAYIRASGSDITFGTSPSSATNSSLFASAFYIGTGVSGSYSASAVFARSANGIVGWHATNATGSPDTRISNPSAGNISLDTTASGNGLANLSLTNLTASGTVIGASITGQAAVAGTNSVSVDNTIGSGANFSRFASKISGTEGIILGSVGSGVTITSAFLSTRGAWPLIINYNNTAAISVNSATSTGLQFNGYGAGAITSDASGNLTAVSDVSVKNDIRPFERGLNDILLLSPILHGYTKESGLDQTKHDYAGFSAQNVRDVIPEAVGQSKDGLLTLADRPILAALVNAVKEQQSQINKLMKA